MTTPTMNQQPTDLRLRKREKLCSQTAIDALFVPATPTQGALAYPLRAVWAKRPENSRRRETGAQVQFMISVPKKRLRHAVDRVRMRRLIREAYRLNRSALPADLSEPVDLAFIYVAPTLLPYYKVERAMLKILPQLAR